MTRPEGLNTKIFLDSGNPADTKETLDLIGFLDGQTTNPSLIAKNPDIQQRISDGGKLSDADLRAFYKKTIQEIHTLLPKQSISIEVYADKDTSIEEIVSQAREMNSWIPTAHIKLPTTHAGLSAAEILSKEHMKLNMTLVFSEEQAAAVYAATTDAFVSPFVGRLDDIGKNGMDLIKNIQQMYAEGNGHVQILVASIRTLDHFYAALSLQADIATVPLRILQEWKNAGMPIPETNNYSPKLSPIAYQNVTLNKPWNNYNIHHDLTDAGLERFAQDWNALLHK
ncbi:transaldolase [Patescibacteria group bacterium]|nr:transaldolase [Patescibacteria group bacterium]MBU1721190.1 transaldolase [Patescibacteria group bacterium]MBU1901102.1 transaldolase [Patescibacteria group bacterium]